MYMLIAYGSDLHLEFDAAYINMSDMPDAELLILAGDVIEINALKMAVKTSHPNTNQKNYIRFFKDISAKYAHVLWVFGNHEYWSGEFNFAISNAKKCLLKIGITNIHILENSSFELDHVSFFGTTLWTSCANKNPIIMWDVSRMMNDYERISVVLPYKEKRKFMVDDSVLAHERAVKAIEKFSASTTKESRVLITHHAMSFQSVNEYHRGDTLNYAYANDLDNLLCYSNFKYAFHGHMHDEKDYMLGDCRVLTAPRGYFGSEVCANNYIFKTVNISN